MSIEKGDLDGKIVMYGTPICPMVPPAKGILRRAGTDFLYVDITQDSSGRAHVQEINHGFESVPTFVFPDGSTLTEPPMAQLKEKLVMLGYTVKPPTLLQSLTENPFFALFGLGALLFAAIDHNVVFLLIGLGFIAYVLLKDRLHN